MKVIRPATLVILPIAVTFLLRGRSFIGLWMGHEYGEQSGRVLCILDLALVFVAGNQVAISTMMGIGKHKPVVLVVLRGTLQSHAEHCTGSPFGYFRAGREQPCQA